MRVKQGVCFDESLLSANQGVAWYWAKRSEKGEAIGQITRKDGFPAVLGLLSITGSHEGRWAMEKNSQSSKASLDKCHLRWFLLFDKIMKILWECNPSLVKTVRYNLFRFGLGNEVFRSEPSEEVLQKVKAFHGGKMVPLKLKGKQKEGKCDPSEL